MSHISKIELEVKDLGSAQPGMRPLGINTYQRPETF